MSMCTYHDQEHLHFATIYIGYYHQCYDRTSEDNSSPTRFNMSMVLLHLENAAIFLIRIKLTDKYN